MIKRKVLEDLEEKRSILEGLDPAHFPKFGDALIEYGRRCREREERKHGGAQQ